MFYRARYYDTATGEFISRDPLEYVDGMSLYRGYFVPGATDPSGRKSCKFGRTLRTGPVTAVSAIGGFGIGVGLNPGTVSMVPAQKIRCKWCQTQSNLFNCTKRVFCRRGFIFPGWTTIKSTEIHDHTECVYKDVAVPSTQIIFIFTVTYPLPGPAPVGPGPGLDFSFISPNDIPAANKLCAKRAGAAPPIVFPKPPVAP